jgi:hypothetical protein
MLGFSLRGVASESQKKEKREAQLLMLKACVRENPTRQPTGTLRRCRNRDPCFMNPVRTVTGASGILPDQHPEL